MLKATPLLKGIGSFFIPALRTTHKPQGTVSADHCYSIFLRHISLLHSAGVNKFPKVVAELGPGSSFGTGFAALIAGAEKYYALDLIDHSSPKANLEIFDQLVSLYKRKAAVPATGYHSQTFPDLGSYEFPDFLAIDPEGAMSERRVGAIREDIVRRTGKFFEVAAPWTESNIVQRHSIEWLFSHSVLEHVDDLVGTYHCIAEWLKPGAYTTHLIDFYSHGLTYEWNGHWAIKDVVWRALRGKRPYLLNREWCETHIRLAAENGFQTIFEKRNMRHDGLVRQQFEPRFRAMTDQDSRTRMVFLIQQHAS
jgi:hypothetical protein